MALVFDPYAADFDEDPYPMYQALRERDPVHWWEPSQAWVISRYADVAALLRDRRFSLRYEDWELAKPRNADGPSTRAFLELLREGFFVVDVEKHARLRKLLSPAFTPRAIERLRGDVEAIVDAAVSAWAPGDRVDIASAYAATIPVRVIASSVLGVPRADEAIFRRFAESVAAATSAPWLSADEIEALTAPVPEGVALVRALIEERRAHPRDDLLTTLIHLEEEGDRLSLGELLSLVASIIIAGSETTVHAIAFAVLDLLRHPSELAAIVAEPERIRTAVDELLRFNLFGRIGAHRFALEDVELHGRTIKKGQMALLLVASALRDEVAFPDPSRLDVRRDTATTVAFGAGPHYCLGASLARLELEVALGKLFRRFPRTTLEGAPVYAPHLTMRKIAELPVRLA